MAELARLKIRNENGLSGSKAHLVRLKKSICSVTCRNRRPHHPDCKKMFQRCKREAQEGIEVETLKAGVLELLGNNSEPQPPLEKTAEPRPPPSPSPSPSPSSSTSTSSQREETPPSPPTSTNYLSDPSLVHRILLHRPGKLHEVTVDGSPRLRTLTYEEVAEGDVEMIQGLAGEDGVQKAVAGAMMKAYWDGLRESVELSKFDSFSAALEELRAGISQLSRRVSVPEIQAPKGMKSTAEALKLLGSYLEALESPERATTTAEWLEKSDRLLDR